MKHWLGTAAVALALAVAGIGAQGGGLVAQAASSTPPPTLTGETLFGFSSGNTNTFPCNADGSGTFTFSGSGTASGPYNGTFTESGTATVDSAGRVTAFSAQFTIQSLQGTVTGSKTLTPGLDNRGTCTIGRQVSASAATTYRATIATPSGNYSDQGTSFAAVQIAFGSSDNTFINETFTSSQTQTTLIAPTSKDQCKNGGYQNFPQFKNQGQCVSYVESQHH